MRSLLLSLAILLFAPVSHAWWNDDWTARKQITLDTTATGAEIKEGLANLPVLVRLHNGNFDFLGAKPDGSDLRFVAADDKTPLKFHLEKFDPMAEMAFVWVQVPKLEAGDKAQHIWLYSGNEAAVAETDAKGTYDASHAAVFHFSESGLAPQDATGNALHATDYTGARVAGSVIGGGLGFDGQKTLTLPASGALNVTAANGMSVSMWVKPTATQSAVLFALSGNVVVLGLETGKPYAEVAGVRTSLGAELAVGTWSHVAVSTGAKAVLYVNGVAVGEAAAACPDVSGTVTVGKGFTGEVDELDLAVAARSADWFKAAALGQGMEAKLVAFGEDEGGEDGGDDASYFGVILQNVTLDGWVVIAILMVMMAIAFLVMISKALVVNKTDKANAEFLNAFRGLRMGEAARLDASDDPNEADLQDSALLTAMFGKHDHYQNSSLYRIYHSGIQELKYRFGDAGHGELSPQAIDVVKATLDGTLVRENQKLNSLMVLLTIAISGGPFLGLLGTVVGVMITFAAIAATGDVNIAAIAPGIAAALVATVAGLAVAIPALFGYNYLGSRIKSISADMHVFVDEFLAKVAENYSR